jgi:3-hydroxybutyryl-CoA dehydrogenase
MDGRDLGNWAPQEPGFPPQSQRPMDAPIFGAGEAAGGSILLSRRSSLEIKTVMVAGAGFMGSGIAQVSAAAGYRVLLWDVKRELVETALDKTSKALDDRVAKGKMTPEEKSGLLERIEIADDLAAAGGSDLVIEAVLEDLAVKSGVFKTLDEICGEKTIFASNTSAIPITNIANATKRADRFIGMHFFSPVPVMKLVEIVRGLKSSAETCETAKAFVASLNKVGVPVKDSPGFLINRVMHAFRQEVFACMEEGVAAIEDIDTAVKLGLGHPLGPFELNDFAGLDIGAATIQTLYENFKDPKWRPNLTLKKLVAAGDLGCKTGKGWYDYTSGKKMPRDDVNF